MDSLAEDLLVEIVSRLPLKSLMLVGCLCKPLRSMRRLILSNHNFVKLHKLRNPDNNNHDNDSITIAHYIPKYEYHQCHKLCVMNMNFLERPPINLILPLPTCTKPVGFSVVGSCNGLLCIAYMRKKKPRNMLCLWNPIGQLKKIHNYTISIKFDKCDVSLGFGFDHASADYKVVRIVRDLRKGFPSDASRVEVYSLNKGVWKEIDVELKFRVLAESCVTVRGVFYWLTEDDIALHNFGLVSFNMQSEKFRTIVLHNGIIMSQWLPNIFNYKDSLAITQIHYPDKDISIWTLLDDNTTWILVHDCVRPVRDIVGGLSKGKYVGVTANAKFLLCDPMNNKYKFMKQLPECSVLRTYNHSPHHQFRKCTLRIYDYSASLVIL